MFKKKKKKEEIKPIEKPKEPFIIPKIVNNEEGLKKKRDGFENTPFASAIWGYYVKDVTAEPLTDSLPYTEKSLDFLRKPEDKKIKEKDYYEFGTMSVNNADRKRIFGDDALIVDNRPKEKPAPKETDLAVPFNIGKKKEKKKKQAEVTSDQFQLDLDMDNLVGDPVQITFDAEEQDQFITEEVEIDDFKPVVFDDEEIQEIKPEPKPEPKTVKKEEKVAPKPKANKNYKLPPLTLLRKKEIDRYSKPEWIDTQTQIINNTLLEFGIDGHVCNFTKGPSVTRYEISLSQGISVKKVTGIEDNIKMNLAARTLRIEAPIPGKTTIGIEVPNAVCEDVAFGNICDTPEFKNSSRLSVAMGIDIGGACVYSNINKMPHGLVAGATGSGKSVCINTLIVSLLLKNRPDELKMMMVDPKQVELSCYNDLPHLITPVISDPKMAAQGLKWTVDEMERRYNAFTEIRGVRNIDDYNRKISEMENEEKMPYIVVIIDELADLMMVAGQDVEDYIQRLTQKSRAAGIHLILATQRPTTNVVKGTIKANIPTRIAFRVASFTDSITILDYAGAETLLGRGDMLIKNEESTRRVQGAYISSEEIDAVCDYITAQAGPDYLFSHDTLKTQATKKEADDDLFPEIARYVVNENIASINRIQKEFNVGFNRAQKIFDIMESYGIVSSGQGGKAREVLITPSELEDMLR